MAQQPDSQKKTRQTTITSAAYIGIPVTLLRDCTHQAQRIKINSNMAALPFVGTLDSDDDVEQFDNETDSEDESEKVFSNFCLL